MYLKMVDDRIIISYMTKKNVIKKKNTSILEKFKSLVS